MLEQHNKIGGRIGDIGSITNFAGFTGNGSRLAELLSTQLAENDIRTTPGRVTSLTCGDQVKIATEPQNDSGLSLECDFVVWAAGQRPLTIFDVCGAAPVVETELTSAFYDAIVHSDRPVVVVGADRPLGTLLRSITSVKLPLHVLAFPHEAYKLREIETDPRIHIERCQRLLGAGAGKLNYETMSGVHRALDIDSHMVVTNLGSRPNTEPLVDITNLDQFGFPVVTIARHHAVVGDARSARGQRISTAIGSGAEAVLRWYYDRERSTA